MIRLVYFLCECCVHVVLPRVRQHIESFIPFITLYNITIFGDRRFNSADMCGDKYLLKINCKTWISAPRSLPERRAPACRLWCFRQHLKAPCSPGYHGAEEAEEVRGVKLPFLLDAHRLSASHTVKSTACGEDGRRWVDRSWVGPVFEACCFVPAQGNRLRINMTSRWNGAIQTQVMFAR